LATAVFALRKFSLHEEVGGEWLGIIGIVLVLVLVLGAILRLAIGALRRL
jgi:hypothetical protein